MDLISTQTYKLKACARTTDYSFILHLVTKEEHRLVGVNPESLVFLTAIFDGFIPFFISSMNVSRKGRNSDIKMDDDES